MAQLSVFIPPYAKRYCQGQVYCILESVGYQDLTKSKFSFEVEEDLIELGWRLAQW
jgi:hypothetical protein